MIFGLWPQESGKNIPKKTWLLFPYYAEIGEDLELHVLKDIVYIL